MSQPALQPVAAPTVLSDEEVVERVLAGDVSLFEILMRRYNQRLFRVARGILADDAEAEDVVQEAYVRAFRELASFRGEALFSTWLTRIACHEALARARKRRRLVPIAGGDGRDGGGGEPPDPPSEAIGPEREQENRELQAVLREAVELLPDPLRAVFCLREIEGLSTEETAGALDLTVENVRVRLHRAKRSLRQTLDERIGREVRRLYLFDGPRCDRIVEGVFARILREPPARRTP
ncbi:MAG TPA: RNA polymerase sigma factor [Thermoanaerobaculia bacterium]|jgi:RNA polymerase sigma-70 factor (ECF subfamily)|nr:RNA polymerase sigma factor [Thermoanaerobaculia bacterium]